VTGGNSFDPPWEDDDAYQPDDPAFDAFDAYLPATATHDNGSDPDPLAPDDENAGNDGEPTLLFTASNPGETVSATAAIGGQIIKIDLAPRSTEWTEAELATEIMVIARLARRQAQAAQYAIISAYLRQLGQDEAATRGLLQRNLGLPSPDSVRAERAELLSGYGADDDGD